MLPKLYPKQKAIRVIKQAANRDNPYTITNRAALQKARRTLKGNTFKVWSYIGENQNEYEFGFSSSEAAKELGINGDTVRAAIKELIEKGYLVEVELYPNLTGYLFIESGDGGEEKKTENFD